MTIQQMLKSWGIIMAEENNDSSYLPEYLLQNYSSKCYFVDFFPKRISKEFAHKFDQIEGEIYNLIYNRVYNAVLKLWVYDNLYFESELLYNKISFKSAFSLNSIKRRNLLKTMDSNFIEKEKHLRILMKLSNNNIIDLALAFEKLHMVIVPSWSCFFVFVEDDSALPFISKVFDLEGLYLRNNSKN